MADIPYLQQGSRVVFMISFPLILKRDHVIEVGERYLPCNLNIIMLTFTSHTPSKMAASQITTPLLLFIAASQSLNDSNAKNKKTIGLRSSLKNILHMNIHLRFNSQMQCVVFSIAPLRSCTACSWFNVKRNCSHYLQKVFYSTFINTLSHTCTRTHTNTQRALLKKSVTTHPCLTTIHYPTAADKKLCGHI